MGRRGVSKNLPLRDRLPDTGKVALRQARSGAPRGGRRRQRVGTGDRAVLSPPPAGRPMRGQRKQTHLFDQSSFVLCLQARSTVCNVGIVRFLWKNSTFAAPAHSPSHQRAECCSTQSQSRTARSRGCRVLLRDLAADGNSASKSRRTSATTRCSRGTSRRSQKSGQAAEVEIDRTHNGFRAVGYALLRRFTRRCAHKCARRSARWRNSCA